MHPSQQHSSPHLYYDQDPNASSLQSYNAGPTSPHGQPSRSSSISGAIGYEPVASPQYFTTDMHQQQHYAQQHVYSQDTRHYPSNANTHLPSAPSFLGTNRSTSDGVTYTTRQHDTGSPSEYRRSSISSLSGGPTRGRTVSLSYSQSTDATGATYDPYGRQQYQQDPRYSSSAQMFPPTSYRGGMPLQQSHSAAPSSRPVPSLLDTSITYPPEYLPRRASVSSHSPTHLRREMPVSSTSQAYQQPGSSSPSSSQPRPHVSEVCGVGFARGHDLKRHKDTHSNSKPHVCECGKSFSRKDALKRHVFLKSCRGEKHTSGYATAEE